ncbi:MAG: PepSY domain-containing protein [Planctomycetota bacterium]
MKARYFVFSLVLICGLGCATFDDMFDKENEVPLSEVPAEALEAAQGAVDGVTITEAEMEKEDGETVYVFEGEANGKEYEIEVTPEGKVLEVEEEGDEEDEGEDDDD